MRDFITRLTAAARNVGSMLSLLLLTGCAELAAELIDSIDLGGACWGCNWIIQEWDGDVGWNTHNSDPYDTEELCEQELARQSGKSEGRGYRCIHEEDLIGNNAAIVEQQHCWGCDWMIEEWRYGAWTLRDTTTYLTEGVWRGSTLRYIISPFGWKGLPSCGTRMQASCVPGRAAASASCCGLRPRNAPTAAGTAAV